MGLKYLRQNKGLHELLSIKYMGLCLAHSEYSINISCYVCVCVCAGDATECKARKVSAGAAMLGGAMCRNMCECYATSDFKKKHKTTWETDRSGGAASLQGEFRKASLRSWYLS